LPCLAWFLSYLSKCCAIFAKWDSKNVIFCQICICVHVEWQWLILRANCQTLKNTSKLIGTFFQFFFFFLLPKHNFKCSWHITQFFPPDWIRSNFCIKNHFLFLCFFLCLCLCYFLCFFLSNDNFMICLQILRLWTSHLFISNCNVFKIEAFLQFFCT
jgi:hypothetical protein